MCHVAVGRRLGSIEAGEGESVDGLSLRRAGSFRASSGLRFLPQRKSILGQSHLLRAPLSRASSLS